MRKKILFSLILVCIGMMLVAGCSSSQPTTTAPTQAPATTVKTTRATTVPTTAAPVQTPAPIKVVTTQATNTGTATLGETNAALKAKQYLNFMAFSQNGLIKQLEYEGFTPEQSEYGVTQSGADWNVQATLKAKQYLKTMPFSRTALIAQLEYDGFTPQQAGYGVQSVGL